MNASSRIFNFRRWPFSLLALVLATAPLAVHAQWQTQSLVIKPGWTAVYLFVDASYSTLDSLVGSDPNNPITEVWLWQPVVSSVQFVSSPLNPITGSSQWANWERLNTGLGGTSTLAALAPNCAYLIHSTATSNYTWKVLGKPTPPSYFWSSTSINLVGFPTVSNSPPPLDTFLGAVPALQTVATVYQYIGGDLSAINPSLVFAPHAVPVSRGQAFWIDTPAYANGYFGPFQVSITGGATAFGTNSSVTTFHLVNPTLASVTVNLTLLPSETPPAGQAPIAGVPPVIVRGALNAADLTYAVSNVTTTSVVSWTLKPQGQTGSDITVTLGVNRAALTNSPGALYAGILKFTDANNFTEVDLPVSAQPGSYAGLWVGSAALSQVSNYLKNYQTNPDGSTAMNTNSSPVTNALTGIVTTPGAYIVSSLNTSNAPVASSAIMPLRLILHNDGTNVNLLQRVFYGSDVNTNTILATGEGALDAAQKANARRISAVHLPWTPTNQIWQFTGQLVPGGSLSTTASVAYDDQTSNPFLHTYHPDHDNLDATFQNELTSGLESYGISRQISLNIAPAGNDFTSLTQFGQTFSGTYAEAITLSGLPGASRTFNVNGVFTLNRLSAIATLIRSP